MRTVLDNPLFCNKSTIRYHLSLLIESYGLAYNSMGRPISGRVIYLQYRRGSVYLAEILTLGDYFNALDSNTLNANPDQISFKDYYCL